MMEANLDPADYGENFGRGIACEVIARRVVHTRPRSRLNVILSTRFPYHNRDGDDGDFSSALELAIDSHWYCRFFYQVKPLSQLTQTVLSSCLPMKLRMVRSVFLYIVI
jgi:hypothetical protein